MIVEVIAVGTELLIGQIVNGNAAVIGGRLAEEGFDAHYQVTVGDNLARLTAAIETALARSEAVVITGGIGPTQDDLTREALCRVGGRPMVRDEAHAAWIEDRIRSQTGALNPTVLRMADLPEGAEGLPNDNGVALGVAMEVDGHWVFALPGVPVEMASMLDCEVLPRLRRLSGGPAVLHSRVLRIWGRGESRIAEALDDLFASTNPSVAFLISDMEVKVRITAKATDEESAKAAIEPIEQEIRSRLGNLVFGANDETVEMLLVAALRRRSWTLTTLEHATLGQVGARVAATNGAGEVFAGALIPGSAVSTSPPAGDVRLVVGPIGPDRETDHRTTRSVDITVITPTGETTRAFDFGGDDERVRAFATIAALHCVRLALTEQDGT